MIDDLRLTRTNNGFPQIWKAGQLEKELLDIVSLKIKSQLKGNVLLINSTWMHDDNVSQLIKTKDPDYIIMTNLVDPAIPNIFSIIRSSGRPFVIIGNATEYRVDFWSIACSRFFKTYRIDDLILQPDCRLYLCYNRKPHGHRIHIARRLVSELPGLDHVSLGLPDDPIRLEENFSEDQGISDEYSNLSGHPQFVDPLIRNDIYSLGDLRYWNDSLINIVTETEFWNPVDGDFFISEKTWKPIIGLRPFIVYGQPKLLEYLESQGFDTFRDIISYPDEKTIRSHGILDAYSSSAIDCITRIKDAEKTFQELLPRLIKNRDRFWHYAKEQFLKLLEINLGQILYV